MENKIKEGEWIRTIDNKIGIFDRYSSRKEESCYKSQFNCFVRLQKRKTPLQCCEDYIAKHSPNKIDLIEEGDYVNGEKVLHIDNCLYGGEKVIITELNKMYYDNQIKTIVTKEQFEMVEYKL